MKTPYTCLIKMADNAFWAQKMYLQLGMYDQYFRYYFIWNRLMKAANQKAYDECFGHMGEFKGMDI